MKYKPRKREEKSEENFETRIQKERKTTFTATEAGVLMSFLIEKLKDQSRTAIKSLLSYEQVAVNGKFGVKHDFGLRPGDEVAIHWNKVYVSTNFKGLRIVFEDEYILVVEKEAGLLTISTGNEHEITAYKQLYEYLKAKNPSNKIFIVHRLDRDTSGLLLFAKSEKVKKWLQENWDEAVSVRNYVAVVEGEVEQKENTIISYLHENDHFKVFSSQNPALGQKAITHYRTLEHNRYYSLLEVALETGRKNQIRVHMQDIGHPVIGDKKYGSTLNPIHRLGLHAWKLSFYHPALERDMDFETKIPERFLQLFSV